MSSFSRRRIVATTTQRISEPALETSHTAETEEDGSIQSADEPAAESATSEDVDFDVEIAEVLMTLATGPGTAGDASAISERVDSATLAQVEREDDTDLDDEGASDSDDDAADETPDPEALLAAEAATFRLLGELDRLWHRAA